MIPSFFYDIIKEGTKSNINYSRAKELYKKKTHLILDFHSAL